MRDKRYAHPLYSLDLLTDASLPADEARFVIPVPEGHLVVRSTLRRRAARLSTEACERAIGDALVFHRLDVPGFGGYGLDADWAENLVYWGRRLHEVHHERDRRSAQGLLATRERQQVIAGARDLWSHLSLASRLAGIEGTIIKGRAPYTPLELGDALDRAAERARKRAGVLAGSGFGPADQERLAQVIAALGPLRQQAIESGQEQQDQTCILIVMRGAIVGDLGRLCTAAVRVLPPLQARELQMQKLFPRARRRPQDGTGAAPAPDQAAP